MTNKQYMGIRLDAGKPPDGGGTDIPKTSLREDMASSLCWDL